MQGATAQLRARVTIVATAVHAKWFAPAQELCAVENMLGTMGHKKIAETLGATCANVWVCCKHVIVLGWVEFLFSRLV